MKVETNILDETNEVEVIFTVSLDELKKIDFNAHERKMFDQPCRTMDDYIGRLDCIARAIHRKPGKLQIDSIEEVFK